MDMIGHQHIGVQLATGRPERLAEPVLVGQVAVLDEEAGVPVMPSLPDVQGHAGKVDAGAAWHEV